MYCGTEYDTTLEVEPNATYQGLERFVPAYPGPLMSTTERRYTDEEESSSRAVE